jgi:hypothetical protein
MSLNFTAANRLSVLPDVSRDYLFNLLIPNINLMTGGIIDQEGLVVRAKTASIPSRGNNDDLEMHFLGTYVKYPGKPTFSNKLSVTLDETEDQIVLKAISAWQQRIFDMDPNSPTAGYSQAPNKAGLCTPITLKQYKFNGEQMGDDIVFYSAWPSNRDDVNLDMNANGKVVHTVTFTWDYWLLQPKV